MLKTLGFSLQREKLQENCVLSQAAGLWTDCREQDQNSMSELEMAIVQAREDGSLN